MSDKKSAVSTILIRQNYIHTKIINSSRKDLKPAAILLAVILAVCAFIALKYGGNFITAAMGGMGGPRGMGGPMCGRSFLFFVCEQNEFLHMFKNETKKVKF